VNALVHRDLRGPHGGVEPRRTSRGPFGSRGRRARRRRVSA
jgi:hypothetical protein